MSVEANKRAVAKFHDAMALCDGEAALACLAPGATWWTPADEPGGTIMTKEQLAGVLGFFSALFSQNPQTTLLSLTAEEDRVVLEKTARDGLTPGGARYGNDYLMLFRLREGMIVEIREYYDPRKVEPLYSEMQANQPGNQA